MKKGAGFTLIEVMIALAIVGLLASIAYPSFLETIRKSRRADATTALLELQLQQEKYRSNNSSYATTLIQLGWASGDTDSTDGFYTLAISSGSATGFSATATPKTGSSQEHDGCTFTITQDGPDISTSSKRTCWNKQ